LSQSSTLDDIRNALNDLPTLAPNLVTNVTVTSQPGDSDLVYLVTFSSDLGDVPLLQSDAPTLVNVTEIAAGSTSRSTIQLLIEDVPSSLINLDASIANVSVYDL